MVDRLASVSESIAQTLAGGIQFLIMLVSGYMILQGNMTAGVLLALIQLSGSFVQPVAVIMQSMSIIQGVKPVVERVLSLGQKQPSAFSGTQIPVYQENIELRDVSFGYKPEQMVLNEVSLTERAISISGVERFLPQMEDGIYYTQPESGAVAAV